MSQEEFRILLVEDKADDAELFFPGPRNSSIANVVQLARDGAEALALLFSG
jgi:hypothetical protein